jgi:hypothetical protein
LSRIRRCDKRCHNAKHDKCRCWCGGTFHGSGGAANRQAVQDNPAALKEMFSVDLNGVKFIFHEPLKITPDSPPEDQEATIGLKQETLPP